MNQKNSLSFASLGLKSALLKQIEKLGFQTPSAIQQEAIPCILEGNDLIALARTGTGKTAAFGLPALELTDDAPDISLLVITPTRELCQQVCQELLRFCPGANSSTVQAVYGGEPIFKQIKDLKRNPRALVATPGRLLDLLKNNKIPRFSPSLVVLDEADEMLDMGFFEDIQAIFEYLPETRQTLLFSATMSPSINKLAQSILQNPVTINTRENDNEAVNITQEYYLVKPNEKQAALLRLLDCLSPSKAIVFCRTKKEVDELFLYLNKKEYRVESLHGDMAQEKRQRSIKTFKQAKQAYLIATDVAGRGLDISDVSHIFNLHLPDSSESYTHRIGRTGRAGQAGSAISLVSPQEFKKKQYIVKQNAESIRFCTLPSLEQIKKKQANQLIEALKAPSDNIGEAKTLLRDLSSKMSLEDAALSLLSWALGKQKTLQGPENIGLTWDSLNQKKSSGGSSRGERSSRGRSSGERSSRDRSFNERSSRDRSSRDRFSKEGTFGERSPRNRSSRESSFGERSSRENSFGERSSREGSFGERSSKERSFKDFKSSKPSFERGKKGKGFSPKPFKRSKMTKQS